MSKPPLRMTVAAGHLVPATPHDAERFDAWRNGTVVNVRFTREKQRIQEVIWWAAINRAVKHCATPWKTADEASEAIKLALGIVNLTKTVKGAWASYPKSLTELDEPELDEAVERLFDVLYGVTGVHCEDWREQARLIKEAAAPQGSPPASDDEETEPAATQSSPAADEAAAGGSEASPCDAPANSSLKAQLVGSLKLECINKLLVLATDNTLTEEQRAENLDLAASWWRDALPADHAFVHAVTATARRVSEGKTPPPGAKHYLEELAR